LGPGAQANVALQINVPAAVPVSPPGTLVTATMDIFATLGGSYLGGISIFVLVDV
jgi:hypothetical protein